MPFRISSRVKGIEELVDKQVKQWVLTTQRKESPPVEPEKPLPVITFSREKGAEGSTIGKQVAEKLGFHFFDSVIIDHIAGSAKISKYVIQSLDEKHQNMLEEIIRYLLQREFISPTEYVEHLMKVILTVSQVGKAVIVGRGASFVIPEDRRFSVRLIAPLDVRIKRIAVRESVDEKKAHAIVQTDDNQRDAFIKVNFNRDINDPLNYDMLVNTGTISVDKTSDLIITGFKSRFPG